MLIVPLDEAKEGMRLAATITHPDHPGQDLLKAGFVLSGDILPRLRDLGIDLIYVDYPDLADLDRHLAPYLSPERQAIYRQVRDAVTATQKSARPTIRFPDYYTSTRQLIDVLLRQGQNAVYLDQMSGRMGGDAVAHATAVAHLSLMIGLRMEQYLVDQRSRLLPRHARDCVNLGVAGMLHDLGLSRLPEQLRKHSRLELPQSEKDLAEWRTHPELGYEMVTGSVEPTAASAILHHHQHFDGSGFPFASPAEKGAAPRPAGNKIHVFARIIATADIFDRLSVGPDRLRRPNIEILHLMRTRCGAWLDPEILDALPSIVPPFPPGMKVRLSDGTEAFTISLKSDKPYQPGVRRIADGQTLTLHPEVIDLSKPGVGLRVTHVNGRSVDTLVPAAA